ncbi:hypothetical protein Tco_1108957 [Tanacetum coccineum]
MALANEERVFVLAKKVPEMVNGSRYLYKSEQIPIQKKKILGIDQLTKDTSSSGPKDPVFVKSSGDNSEVSITGINKPKLSEAQGSTMSNHDTGKHPLPPLEKLVGTKPVPGAKTIKSNLKSNPTFKAQTLKGITLKEPSSTPAKDNKKGSLALKTSSAPTGKLTNVIIEDDPPLAIVMKELKLQLSKKNLSQQDYFSEKRIKPRNPQHVTKHCETYGSNADTTTDHNDIEWFRKGEAKKAGVNKTTSSNVQRSKTPTQSWVSKQN